MRVNVGARSDASFLTVGNPVNAREMNSQPYGPVPGLGQHTVEILREFGYRDPEIEDLLTSKVVAAATAPAFAEGS
jgi:crotonobetainyl-CoA:carnitine CoA-transferase CaiB-like acyl-CoA transferase